MGKAVIIRGYCGSGKSTVAQRFATDKHWAFLEYDTFLWSLNSTKKPTPSDYQLAWKNLNSVLDNFLAVGKNLVIEGPLVARTEHDPFSLETLIKKLKKRAYKVTIIQLRASKEVTQCRMEIRNHVVPEPEQRDFIEKHKAQTLPEEIVIDTSNLSLEEVQLEIEKRGK
jgi:gluconate kinase